MSIEQKPLSDLSEKDLLQLIDNQVAERKTIEYKRERVGKSANDRKEFLYDVSSFANASGGHIVFGMDEKEGVPSELIGLPGIDPDQEILRLEEMVRDGVRPYLPGLELTPVGLSGGSAAIVIRIPKSWNPPHQVIFQKAFRFYGRGSNGKYLLDVDELRSIFSLSERLSEKIRQFRVHRIAQIVAKETPVSLVHEARQILHLVPLSAFAAGTSVDFSKVLLDRGRFISVMDRGGSMRHNVDGLLAYSPSGDGTADAYGQLYRSGIIEIVHALENSATHGSLPSTSFEAEIIHGVYTSREIFKSVGVSPPVVVMLSFVGIKGLAHGCPTWC